MVLSSLLFETNWKLSGYIQKIRMIQQENSNNRYKNRKIYAPPPKEDYSTNFKKLVIVIIISFIFIAGEFVGGIISGSISVISDAFHLVTDLIGFTVSFFFIWFSRKKPNQIISFGYHRMELMGALGNLFIIWALAIFLIYQATLRIINKEFVKQPLAMLIVAAAGLPINIIMYFVLHAGDSHSHGLMSQKCGEQFPLQQINAKSNKKGGQLCSEILCEDVQCLISNAYEDHCHKQQGDSQSIHKHKNKVEVQGDKIIRKSSKDIVNGSNKLDQNKKEQQKHNHNHGEGCNHDHDHGHKHEHGNQHEHSNCKIDDHKHNNKNENKDNQTRQQNQDQIQQNNGQTNQNKKKKKKNKNKKNISGSENQIHPDHQDENNHNHNHDHNHQNQHDHGHQHGNQCTHDHGHGHGHQHDHGHGHSHQSMSMKAAVLHALSDVIQSIGLLISSLVIFFAGSEMGKQVTQWNDWHYFDPISTYIFSIIVVFSTVPIAKNCYQIIMQSVPSHLKYQQIHNEIAHAEGVIDVHDLHIWDLRPGKTIIIAHVFSKIGQQRNVLKRLTDLSRKMRIYHSTFQVEEQQWKDHMEYILCDHDIH